MVDKDDPARDNCGRRRRSKWRDTTNGGTEGERNMGGEESSSRKINGRSTVEALEAVTY